MATSDARIRANQANAAFSTGPKTEAGKNNSRRNSLKHGLTGAGIVLPEADAAEVARRAVKFADELAAVGEVGQALARRAALNSVRMERAADQQSAALTQRIRQVEAEFVAPEGVSDEESDQLRDEAVRIAMFDPSKEANLARRYEMAAERAFYQALKQLRQMELQAEALIKADDEAQAHAMMGSIFAERQATRYRDADFAAFDAEVTRSITHLPANSAHPSPVRREVDVPITIGRPR
jgi:hypothetical protein